MVEESKGVVISVAFSHFANCMSALLKRKLLIPHPLCLLLVLAQSSCPGGHCHATCRLLISLKIVLIFNLFCWRSVGTSAADALTQASCYCYGRGPVLQAPLLSAILGHNVLLE